MSLITGELQLAKQEFPEGGMNIFVSSKKNLDILESSTLGGAFLWGRWGNLDPLETLRESDSVELRDRMERIGESKCYVLEGQTGDGHYDYDHKVWIDPSHGYSVKKVMVILTKRGAEKRLGKPNSETTSKNDRTIVEARMEIDDVKIEAFGDYFVPVSGSMLVTEFFADGTTQKFSYGAKRSNTRFNPDFDAMGAFKIDLPEGALVYLEDSPGGSYIWSKDKKFVVDEYNGSIMCVPKDWQLLVHIGKALPGLNALKLDLKSEQIRDKMMLVCFFDMEQRPSRNCLIQLAKRADELKQKGIAVVAVQAAKVDENKLNQWVKKQSVSFPVGMVQGDEEKTRFTWGVKSLPWLILTDKEHIVRAEGFSINELDVQVESKELVAETGSIEVGVTAESNGRPLEGARVSFVNTETDEDFVVLTNEKGIARIDLMLGDYTMTNVSKEDYASHKQDVLMIVESDKVNRIDIDLAEAPKITGYVRDQNGKGVEGAYVQMVPSGPRNLITDANGKFEFRWDPRPVQLFLVARHIERDLAGSMQFRTGDMGVEIRVGPGLVLTGRVADSNGTGIPEAWVEAKILTARGQVAIAETKVNSNGQYRINALPTGHRYSVQAGREGYGEVFKEPGQKPIHRTSVQVETIVLNVANLSISGVVEDANGNTVKEATVQCWGNGQPKLQTITDAEGKFIIQNVCKGPLRIQAAKDRLTKAIDAEGGKDNMRIVLPAKPFFIRPRQPTAAKTRSLLAGKILPQLGAIDINFNAKQAKGANILVCFFDMNQRPSRVCILQLARRVEELKRKSVTVVAIHAARINEKTLDEWVKKNNMAFPVGMIQGDEEKTRFAWGVKSLPWLILTDEKHVVQAEGFSIAELGAKLP